MRAFNCIHKYFVRKLKEVPRQNWVQQGQDAYVPFQQRNLDHIEIKYFQNIKKEVKSKTTAEKQQIKPISPKMGPYTVQNPKIHDKMYRWCSCGQSLNQPFCDQSHKGTQFKPYKFSIQQKVTQVNLCGCKLTKKKPFCDGQSCKPTVLKENK